MFLRDIHTVSLNACGFLRFVPLHAVNPAGNSEPGGFVHALVK